jgi:5-formyltetrahydrofolate cyclo-ligase
VNDSTGKNDKAALRKQALARRDALPVAKISQDVCRHLAEWPVFQRAEQVLFYFPFRNEVDLRPLYYEFPNKAWFLPAVLPSHDMLFRRVEADFALDAAIGSGRYGIPEPPAHAAIWHNQGKPALLLTPGLMFDCRGYRLGYGKGYYDRFLSQLAGQADALTRVGIVAEDLLCQTLPHDGWDMPMTYLATECGLREVGPSQPSPVA